MSEKNDRPKSSSGSEPFRDPPPRLCDSKTRLRSQQNFNTDDVQKENKATHKLARKATRKPARKATYKPAHKHGKRVTSPGTAGFMPYDFIVVGAGSAGCIVANRLSKVEGSKVLLLETGFEEPLVAAVPAFAPTLQGTNIDWMYRTQPEKTSCRSRRDQGCAWPRGKVMGDSSTINYMAYTRGNGEHSDEWAHLGNYGWDYEHVLPYFRKSINNENSEKQVGHRRTNESYQ